MTVVSPLFPGPLDIVGDVHGEGDALVRLMTRLGYNRHGEHPQGRRLVFVGDLCDRGPDSPGVVRFVRDLCARGLAQVTLGNHELYVLRRQRKLGNDWFFNDTGAPRIDEFADIVEFFESLPVVLERDDLRVVHACWQEDAIERAAAGHGTAHERFSHFESQVLEAAERNGLRAAAREALLRSSIALEDEDAPPPLLPALAEHEAFIQTENPIRVLTSGIERPAPAPFYAGGKWRMVERVRWWNAYRSDKHVVFGHYWRWWNPQAHAVWSKGEPSLFLDVAPDQWLPTADGARAFCIDYSVGARYAERRAKPKGPFEGRLAAMRWPERELLFDS